jgi:hypothetical protein
MADTHCNDSAIREQAYFLWEQDGRPDGRDMEYWQRATVLAAEKSQVDTLTEAPPKRAAAKVKAAGSAASKVKAGPGKSARAKPKKK